MHHLIGALIVGAVAGLTTRTDLRQGLRRVVRGGIVVKRKLQALGAATLAQAQTIVDEARADLDQQAAGRPVTRGRRGAEGATGQRRG